MAPGLQRLWRTDEPDAPMVDASFSISAVARPVAAAAPASGAQPGFFHQLLSELNPLQYVPVVGTIYRAITGDTIPESARFAGSLVVSGLTGGPIGLALNAGVTLAEHLFGIDPEKIGTQVLASLGIGSGAASPDVAATAAPASTPAMASGGWSSAQLAAYGISAGPQGLLTHGTESGADVLNSLELARLNRAPLDNAGWSVTA